MVSVRVGLSRPAGLRGKLRHGPVVVLRGMRNRLMSMGKPLALWFLYSAVVGVFAAYVAGSALPPGAQYTRIVRFAAVTAFVGYSVALWQMSIWYRRALSTTIKATVNVMIYAVLTRATFGWLGPR